MTEVEQQLWARVFADEHARLRNCGESGVYVDVDARRVADRALQALKEKVQEEACGGGRFKLCLNCAQRLVHHHTRRKL